MALTFPLTMPTGGVSSQAWMIDRADFRNADNEGRIGGVSAGFPRWMTTLTLADGDAEEIEAWVAFLDALRGGMFTFYGRDLTRPFPKAYPKGFADLTRAGGGSFAAGTAASWSVNGTRDVLTLNGLPAGLQLNRRDLVGFSWTSSGLQRRAMARYVEAGVASGAGVATLSIEPPLPAFVPGGVTATLSEPTVIMKIDPAQTQLGEMDALLSAGGRIVAYEQLRP